MKIFFLRIKINSIKNYEKKDLQLKATSLRDVKMRM